MKGGRKVARREQAQAMVRWYQVSQDRLVARWLDQRRARLWDGAKIGVETVKYGGRFGRCGGARGTRFFDDGGDEIVIDDPICVEPDVQHGR